MAVRLKETPEDIATKERLWDATEREVLGLSANYAGKQDLEGAQERWLDAQAIAKRKGYPVALVKKVGRLLHGSMSDKTVEAAAALSDYRAKIGLKVGVQKDEK